MSNINQLSERILAYFDMSFGYSLKLTGNHELSKDIVQAMAVSVYEAKPNAELLGEKYFKTAIKNTITDYYRSASFRHDITNGESFEHEAKTESIESIVANRIMIEKIKDVLSEDEWLIVLAKSYGYTELQLAEMFGMKRSEIRYAFIKIQRKVGDRNDWS